MTLLNTHFMRPCVPTGSTILPRNPYFVQSSKGLNQRMSLGLWNMYRATALCLCVRNGSALRITRLRTILSGFASRTDPVRQRSTLIPCDVNDSLNPITGAGPYVMGAYTLAIVG